jgi:serine/threonine protein kinase
VPRKHHIAYSELDGAGREPVLVGRGEFGSVYKTTYRAADVAFKRVKSEYISVERLEGFLSEARLFLELKPHPNVCSFLGICIEPFCIVTE